jgi:hypothetical protein
MTTAHAKEITITERSAWEKAFAKSARCSGTR